MPCSEISRLLIWTFGSCRATPARKPNPPNHWVVRGRPKRSGSARAREGFWAGPSPDLVMPPTDQRPMRTPRLSPSVEDPPRGASRSGHPPLGISPPAQSGREHRMSPRASAFDPFIDLPTVAVSRKPRFGQVQPRLLHFLTRCLFFASTLHLVCEALPLEKPR
ncbi:hypothetical protein BT67DRAFT_175347 [Trichocladium antarcticum]|uniref:Uncharacterized protein n=1 Tax=Trichocladium antarcticum TaxID=1450529 RepID=A0AAN6UP85_9PEZI|nr:hypothetical protein BT67DRAFT_175347 [Trichocladium antarcticum]